MKAIWRGENNPFALLYGKEYTILNTAWDGTMYNVIDETDEDFLYPAEEFEVTEK